jgi:hypothetical protein
MSRRMTKVEDDWDGDMIEYVFWVSFPISIRSNLGEEDAFDKIKEEIAAVPVTEWEVELVDEYPVETE